MNNDNNEQPSSQISQTEGGQSNNIVQPQIQSVNTPQVSVNTESNSGITPSPIQNPQVILDNVSTSSGENIKLIIIGLSFLGILIFVVYLLFFLPAKQTKDSMETARKKSFAIRANEMKNAAETENIVKNKGKDSIECYSYEYLVSKRYIKEDSNDKGIYSGSVLVNYDSSTGKSESKIWFSDGTYKVVTKKDNGSVTEGAVNYIIVNKNVVDGKKASNNCGK